MEGMFYWEESNRFLEFLMGAWGGGGVNWISKTFIYSKIIIFRKAFVTITIGTRLKKSNNFVSREPSL